ncbi:MAM domain-containing glycosylphosphatidylinositol anchor protein 2-like [Mytilus edulis]|uniref:MAM domain-containing glycosylphosphatidylinositol anchor protein 2-like n=1 Tax=Mytilus edulis TaxID=6550 RepID=UPI0039F14824
MKFCCLIVIILFTIRVSNGGRLTGDCLSTNGTCGTSGVTCVAAFGEGWIYKGKCCYGKPCCKYFPESKNYSCGFETVASCVFEDSLLDDFDWSRQSGKTPTSKWKTGPLAAAEGTYYIYTEASDRSNEDKAILTTEATSLQANFISTKLAFNFISPVIAFI